MNHHISKPTFVIIGAPKSGTTSIWDLLRHHPEICMCSPKEPEYFNKDENYAKGWKWYQKFFEEEAKAMGDVTPSYCKVQSYPLVAKRMAQDLPDAKIIYMVRHPFRRLESGYAQCVHTGHRIPLNFSRALREHSGLIETGYYWKTICEYRKYFPDNQILVLLFEEFAAHPERFIMDILRFIGVDETLSLPDIHRARNPTSRHDMPAPWMFRLRELPMFRALLEMFPEFLKQRLRNIHRRPLTIKMEWDTDTLNWVKEQLMDQVTPTLEFAGKPPDYWALDKFPVE